MLEIKNLCKVFKINKKESVKILKDINLEFNMGEMIAIVGESGSGKSTLLNIIGGLDNIYEGSIIVDNKELLDDRDRYQYRKDKVGFVFQSFNLINHMTVRDNIRISSDIANLEEDNMLDVCKSLDIEKLLNKKVSKLSGGEKQRVAIARAIIKNPDIILADEPTGSLDSKNSQMIVDILRDIANRGKLVIIVTHSKEVSKSCNRIITISDGIITSDETKKESVNNQKDNGVKKSNHIKRFLPLKIAQRNMKNKFKRNFLVSIATSIGILSIMLVLSIGNGVEKYLKNGIDDIVDPQIIEVYKDDGTSFKNEDIAIIENISNIEEVEIRLGTMYVNSNNIKNNKKIIAQLKNMGYIVLDQQDIIKTYMDTINLITYVLSAVAAISLIVSMIMITVILYISVMERTKEIGILRSLGLRKKDIKKIFLSESLLIGLLSSVISITMLFIFSCLLNKLSINYFETKLVIVEMTYLFLGIMLSTIISLLAGLYPSRKASNLNIIDSLRRE